MSYSQTFGGQTLYPGSVTYLALALTADTTLNWPLETIAGDDVVPAILDVTPTGAYAITMPDATLTAPGQQVQIFNAGASTITIKDNGGSTLLTITAGLTYLLYLTGNSTAAGTWRSTQLGATTATAQASALAGFGLTVTGSTLSQSQTVTTFSTDYTTGSADRSQALVWTGGLGTLTLPTAASLGNNWFISVRNGGSGNLTVDCSGADTINDATSLVFRPGDSAFINTDGTDFTTVGLGQNPVFAFNFIQVDLTGAGATYTLSGSELNQIAYEFIGVLSNDVKVVVPDTTQQYWFSNGTSGAFTLTAGTATQASPVTLTAGQRNILYCTGSTLVNADTQTFASPIAIADGGTGATTASGARINLGGTATGIAVFTAASQAAGRTALAAAGSGANTDITSLTGLTGLVESNASGGTAPTVVADTLFHAVGATGNNVRTIADALNADGGFLGRRSNGTAGARTGVVNGDRLAIFGGAGYGATAYSASARAYVAFYATGTWTDTTSTQTEEIRFGTADASGITDRWSISDSGHIKPITTNTYDIGSTSLLVRRIYVAGYTFQTPKTVASLTAAATAGAGARDFVSDATATTFASVVAGGGANNVPVYCDGTNWRIG